MKRGLGKGLDALFADNATGDASAPVNLRLSEIEPNTDQPRKEFEPEALSQLADSIRQHGILQPLLVRPIPGTGTYQLVAGERRWRAARMAGLSEAPVVIREMDDTAVLEVALIENLQREDLNPIEEAEGFHALIETYGLTQDEVATRVGKSRPAVANALRLLSLPEKIRAMVQDGRLSQGHARTLLALDNEQAQNELADLAVAKKLSVRELEKLVKHYGKGETKEKPLPSVFAVETERSLTDLFGRKVKVMEGKGKGMLSLEYYGEDDLRALVKRLAGE
ncbi:ParB/RepB/Spo0J family partition protein [Ethanoligenens harbinense]|uniref:ParB-like partition protein n=1 Tax=Ethanoligenens harbinense (strain DSM 18485 / JCM 12961 / CGMCC 1.5033 / YUAN-3) TaxID=663278 RepID=E6U8G3_ETHHY|nr:ParB/RepB/Spo0J family partition protein [Ethanoligenens harbinense]ADU28282.1 parB-like partition protein [Ethanoligenens harbinense YUAN-3]AVQ97276.1 stage 0 sporulation protein J [Ethanoligenens harbinense YUAN-3]AYF39940.1 stage 0 sporulation protein J [Ethanoligenens harbinense]AYF42770.1 stage 0 sporulation protein J [Ethanoligenens harbinense]QCN93520.1 ParB/RepB/Spo0J family partition protein [Ethanoligenens harbinense]